MKTCDPNQTRKHVCFAVVLVMFLSCASLAMQKDPKQTPQNTITIRLDKPVEPQTFARPIKFFIANVIDRSGNPQPILLHRARGGIYLDREPKAVVQEALTDSFKTAGILAADAESADYVLNVYVFHFGLGEGSGMEFYGKIDLNFVVKDRKTNKTAEVTALGTSIENLALRKKNILTNVKANIEAALYESLRNFLRGTKLRDALNSLSQP